ncbi:hypothetical protein [Pseudomonas putida]|uniref:hypothetical protein n=1 Tax=Pseudomonas putida TaxID=303 RepID=UPI001E38E4CA|nr:hypothetical protein [Pseudomonas putida]MCE0958036.1 hypothetical protein [Pseudomonas putida]
MKKTTLLLPLLLPVWAFAFENPCAAGCTSEQIQAINKSNNVQIMQDADDKYWSDQQEKWDKEKAESEARRDEFLRNYVKKQKPKRDTCVASTYAKATAILGDDAIEHISVTTGETIDKCEFTIKQFYPDGKGCDNLAALSSIAKMKSGVFQEEECRYEKEKWEATKEFEDLIYTTTWTTAIDKKYRAALKPVAEQHVDRVRKLQEQEKSKELTK